MPRCRKCGADVPPSGLAVHNRAHRRPARKPSFPPMCRGCRREPAGRTGWCYWCGRRMGVT